MFRRGDGESEVQPPMEATDTARRDHAPGGDVTVVGRAARLEGHLVSAGSLQVDGQVKGNITADGDVTLSAQSVVEADVKAQNVTVAGRFTGDIVARGRAEIARGGSVKGNVTSKTLVVAEGARFAGQSIMGDDGPASVPKAVGGTEAQPSGNSGGAEPSVGEAVTERSAGQ